MKTNFELVKEFHQAFNKVKDPEVPTEQSKDIRNLRVKLIVEEYKEVMEEMGYFQASGPVICDYSYSINLPKLAKELADLLYVVYGTAAAYGIPIDDVYREVHYSNMSKLGEDGNPIYREDGKVLKRPNYKPADIERVLNGKNIS